MNTDALSSTYQAIVDLATTGEFGPPPDTHAGSVCSDRREHAG